jgi:predicted tellurium resistance membrane protein TerC
MEWIFDPQIWASLLTLTFLEIVLGIDNLVFLTLAANTLPPDKRPAARSVGLLFACITRIALLAGVSWVTQLTYPVISIESFDVSWRDVILFAGGLFLLFKGTQEIHAEVEGKNSGEDGPSIRTASITLVALQTGILDIVFSLDSVVTAVGMTNNLPVMIAAILVAIGVMLFSSGPIGVFIEEHPTTKMLALSFLLLIGVALVADGLHFHIPREYLYFSIAFSLTVESLNILAHKRRSERKE